MTNRRQPRSGRSAQGAFSSQRFRGPTTPSVTNELIGRLEVLSRPDSERARSLLQDIAITTSRLMRENRLRVSALCEFYPPDSRLQGLNVNRGSQVLLRLRSAQNDSQFLPRESILNTFLHELTHNRFGPHNDAFRTMLSELISRQTVLERMQINSSFLGTGRALGATPRSSSLNYPRSPSSTRPQNPRRPLGRRLGTTTSNAIGAIIPSQSPIRDNRNRQMAAQAVSIRWSAVQEAMESCKSHTIYDKPQVEKVNEVITITDSDDEIIDLT